MKDFTYAKEMYVTLSEIFIVIFMFPVFGHTLWLQSLAGEKWRQASLYLRFDLIIERVKEMGGGRWEGDGGAAAFEQERVNVHVYVCIL